MRRAHSGTCRRLCSTIVLFMALVFSVSAYTTLLDDIVTDVSFITRIDVSELPTDESSASSAVGNVPPSDTRPLLSRLFGEYVKTGASLSSSLSASSDMSGSDSGISAGASAPIVQVDTASVVAAASAITSSVITAVEGSSPSLSSSVGSSSGSSAAVDRAARVISTLSLQPGATIVAVGSDTASWTTCLGALLSRAHSPDAVTATNIITLTSSIQGHGRTCAALASIASIANKETLFWRDSPSPSLSRSRPSSAVSSPAVAPGKRVLASSVPMHSLLLDSLLHLAPVEASESSSGALSIRLSAQRRGVASLRELAPRADLVWLSPQLLTADEVAAAVAVLEDASSLIVSTAPLPELVLNHAASVAANSAAHADGQAVAEPASDAAASEEAWTVWVYGRQGRDDSADGQGVDQSAADSTSASPSKPVSGLIAHAECSVMLMMPPLPATAREDALLSGWVDAVSPLSASYSPSASFPHATASGARTPASHKLLKQKSDRDDVEDEGADDAASVLDDTPGSEGGSSLPRATFITVVGIALGLFLAVICIVYLILFRQKTNSNPGMRLANSQEDRFHKDSQAAYGHGSILYPEDSELESNYNEHQWP